MKIKWRRKYRGRNAKLRIWKCGKYMMTAIISYHPSWRYMLYHKDHTYDLGCFCTRKGVNDEIRKREGIK